MGGWHYAMILVKKAVEPHEEDEGLLVELYLDDTGEPWGFTNSHLITIKDLELAASDVARQNGVLNTWFYDRGVFSWDEKGEISYKSHNE
jgi:hypothetical protein